MVGSPLGSGTAQAAYRLKCEGEGGKGEGDGEGSDGWHGLKIELGLLRLIGFVSKV